MREKLDAVKDIGSLAALLSVPVLAGGFVGFSQAQGLDVSGVITAAATYAPTAVYGMGLAVIGAGAGLVAYKRLNIPHDEEVWKFYNDTPLSKNSMKWAGTCAGIFGLTGAAFGGGLTVFGYYLGLGLGLVTRT